MDSEVEITPEEIYRLMQIVGRTYYGHHNYQRELFEIAQKLNEQFNIKKSPGETESIFLSGWYLDGEHHGGYEYEEGEREKLGDGILIYREKIKSSETGYQKPSYGSFLSFISVEIWKQEQENGSRYIFLAFKNDVDEGYVGIDNHYGTDTTWSLLAIRILPGE